MKRNLSYHSAKFQKLHTNIHRKEDFFPGQRKDEIVKLCIRPHWLKKVGIFSRFFLLIILLPIAVLFILTNVNIDKNTWSIINLLFLIYFLFIWLFTFIELETNELTVLIITNDRVVDISQSSLFNRQISETGLGRIQEVTGFTNGVFGTFLNIGTLEVQTAGSDMPLKIHNVKYPQLTARKILDIQQTSSHYQALNFRRRENDQAQNRKGENFTQTELHEMRKKAIIPNSSSYKPKNGSNLVE